MESKEYLSEQIITYLGNKRSLLKEIEKEIIAIKKKLKKEKIVACDLFSGSGVVARMLKQHCSLLHMQFQIKHQIIQHIQKKNYL